MITERKAIQEIFDDLQRERKELKANYREDLANLEARQDDLMTRLERLDGIEREAIDPEGLLSDMSATMDKLASLIPQIPASTLLDKTAEKMAEQAKDMGDNAPIIYSEITPEKINEKPKTLLDYSKEHINHLQYTYNIDDVLREIEFYLDKNGISTSHDIEAYLKEKFGWEWKAFSSTFNNWRRKYKCRIERQGYRYIATKGENENGQKNESAPETTI